MTGYKWMALGGGRGVGHGEEGRTGMGGEDSVANRMFGGEEGKLKVDSSARGAGEGQEGESGGK